MTHTFDTEVAKEYGVDIAIVVNNIAFWLQKNKANKKHIYNGKIWTYNTTKAFTELFPYWTDNQIRRILDNMQKAGIIEIGNYNATAYDRTKWYTFTDAFVKTHTSICENTQMDLAKNPNGFDENHEPIPDNKPVDKQDIIYTRFLEKWNTLGLVKHTSQVVQSKWKNKHTEQVKLYGEEKVFKAMENYATIIHSPSYFFDYKWPLWDFIARGLDKFVDDVSPLTNFKSKKIDSKQTDPYSELNL